MSDAADEVHVLEAQNELSWEGVDSLKLKYQLLEEANKVGASHTRGCSAVKGDVNTCLCKDHCLKTGL